MPGGSNPQQFHCKGGGKGGGVNDDKVYQQTLSKDQVTKKKAFRDTGGWREGRVIQEHSIILEFSDLQHR